MYWWAGLLVFILFAIINVAIFFLRKKQKLAYAIVYSIAVFLLVYKIIENIYWQVVGRHMNFPVEFSALSYFILGITVTFRIKKVEQLGAFTSLLAGLMYSISFWVSPGSFILSETSTYTLIAAIFNHHLLYFASMLLITTARHYNYKDSWIMVLGTAIMVGYAWIIYLFTDYANAIGKPTIIQICDGSILGWLGSNNVKGGFLALYIIGLVVIYAGFLVAFYSINNILAKRRKKQGLIQDCYPTKLKGIYKTN